MVRIVLYQTTIMSAASHNTNLKVYRASEVVTYYADLNYLTAAEQSLFDTHLKRGTVLLDLGVGGGRTTPYLSAIASKYIGIDYSEEMIRVCRTKFPTLQFEVRDAVDLSLFANESLDAIVFSFNGIDYLLPSEKRERCLHECYRVLKPGGTFVFSCHNPRSLVVGWNWDWNSLRMKAQRIVGDRGKLIFGVTLAGLSCAKFGISVWRAGIQSLPRAVRRLTTKTYWRGEGYQFDPSHGGLGTHQATPGQVIRELGEFQFKFLEMLSEDHPHKAKNWRTRWYYYAFSKP